MSATLDSIVWFALVVFGLTYLGVAAAITDIPRRFVHSMLPSSMAGVLECAPCFSFWAGLCLGLAGFIPHPAALANLYGINVWQVGYTALPLWARALDGIIGGVISVGMVSAFQGATGWVIAALAQDEEI